MIDVLVKSWWPSTVLVVINPGSHLFPSMQRQALFSENRTSIKYLLNCKCCIREQTFITSISNIYLLHQQFLLQWVQPLNLGGDHELKELKAFTSSDIVMDKVCVARWKRV